MLRKSFILIIGGALLVSSCASMNGAQGAYAGAGFGRVIGSTIGGITNGWRGHEIGSLVGMVGGAVIGGVAGSATEKAQQKKIEAYQQERANAQRYDNNNDYNYDESGYDPQGRGDDRISFENDDQGAMSYHSASVAPLEIRQARIVESNSDGILTRGEECTVILDIVNNTNKPVYDVSPIVEDVTGNKHVAVSPALSIEKIGPRQGIRYTATIKADKRLKNGEILLRVGVKQGQQEVASQSQRFTVPTSKTIVR